MEAAEMFENSMDWLREHYDEYHFFAERDVVWTIQTKLINEIVENDLPYLVFNDYAATGGPRSDLAILTEDGFAVVNAEFKYEPSEGRRFFTRVTRPGVSEGRLQRLRFPMRKKSAMGPRYRVVPWASVMRDIERVQNYVARGKATVAYSVFIDEGGHFFQRKAAPPGSEWWNWGDGRQVLWSRVPTSPTATTSEPLGQEVPEDEKR